MPHICTNNTILPDAGSMRRRPSTSCSELLINYNGYRYQTVWVVCVTVEIYVILQAKIGSNGRKSQKLVLNMQNIHLPDKYFLKYFRFIILNILLKWYNHKKQFFQYFIFQDFMSAPPTMVLVPFPSTHIVQFLQSSMEKSSKLNTPRHKA